MCDLANVYANAIAAVWAFFVEVLTFWQQRGCSLFKMLLNVS